MKTTKVKENRKVKMYLSVASAPLTSTETFEIQDYSNASIVVTCMLRTNR